MYKVKESDTVWLGGVDISGDATTISFTKTRYGTRSAKLCGSLIVTGLCADMHGASEDHGRMVRTLKLRHWGGSDTKKIRSISEWQSTLLLKQAALRGDTEFLSKMEAEKLKKEAENLKKTRMKAVKKAAKRGRMKSIMVTAVDRTNDIEGSLRVRIQLYFVNRPHSYLRPVVVRFNGIDIDCILITKTRVLRI